MAPVSKNGPATSVWDLVEGLHVLVYGQSGTGKTTFAGTFPGPILWLLCSGGARPGELKSIDTPENRRKIRPEVLRESGRLPALVAGAGDCATLVLDHASGLSDLVLKEILGMDELPAQKTWGLASQQQYGQLALQCKEHLRALLNFPGNVVIIAQERVFGGREDGADSEVVRPTVGAALTPSLTGWLNPACDYVVQAFKRPRTVRQRIELDGGGTQEIESRGRGVDYCLRTEPHDVYMTKFRVPLGRKLPDVIVNPTYGKILSVIQGKYAETK